MTFCPKSKRPGFTLIEVLVVVTLVGVLITLLLPAISSVREVARRSSCLNNLSQLVLAVQSYEMAHRVYPPGVIDWPGSGPIPDLPGGQRLSWITRILPYIEQRSLYDHVNFETGSHHVSNHTVRITTISTLLCPSSPNPGWRGRSGTRPPPPSNYAGCHHHTEAPIDENNTGVFFLNSAVRADDVTDGRSNTILLGEHDPGFPATLGWTAGTRATLRNTGLSPNDTSEFERALYRTYKRPLTEITSKEFWATINPLLSPSKQRVLSPLFQPTQADAALIGRLDPKISRTAYFVGGFSSAHPGGVNHAMGDGSVRYIRSGIDRFTYERLGHRADGSIMDDH